MTLQRRTRFDDTSLDAQGRNVHVVRTDELRAGEPGAPMRLAAHPSASMSTSELLAFGAVVMARADATLERVSAGRKTRAAVESAAARLDALNEERSDPRVQMVRARERQADAARHRLRGDADAVTVETPSSDVLTSEQITRVLDIVRQCADDKLSRDGAATLLVRGFPLSKSEALAIIGDAGIDDAGAVDAAGMATDDVVLDAMARARASGRADDVLDNMARSSIVQAPPSAHADPQGLTAAQVAGVRAVVARFKAGTLAESAAIDELVHQYPLTSVEAATVLGIDRYGEQRVSDAASEARRRSDAARGRTTCDTSGLDPEAAMVKRREHQAADARNRALR